MLSNLDPYLRVGAYALLTALATGLGAVPFLFTRQMSERLVGWSGGLASGIMLAASFRLVREGTSINLGRALLGIVIGLAFITISQRILSRQKDVHVGQLEGANALQALLIFGVMTLHSFAEGVGVGVSFGGGQGFGVFIAVAIAVHNIPEGLAISLVLVPKGVAVWKAALFSIVSSLPQPLLAVPSFAFVEVFQPFLPVGLGIAGGAMIWMVIGELLPDAFSHARAEQVAAVAVMGVIGMIAFQTIVGV